LKEFKGLEDWIEIFRGGRQTDGMGREHDGDEIIDKAVNTFNAAEHEPPLVVGHPKDNSPAFGWVQELKTAVKDGVKVLLAKFRQVVPEFAELVKQGVYKKRSAAFYPDGRLRHVGFLGAAPPAVKGLADLKFEDFGTSFAAFDFEDGQSVRHFTEADIEAARAEAAASERRKLMAEFAEKERRAKREAQNRELSEWCDQLVSQGKIAPAWVRMGIKEFCQKLDNEEVYEFSEYSGGTKLEWFKNFIAALPKLIEFREIASRDRDITGASEKFEQLVSKKLKANPAISYSAAFTEVQEENRDLATEVFNEIKK